MNIPDDAVDAAARHLAFYTDRDIDWTVEARALLDAAAPHILESAAHDLAGADKTSHWDDLYRRFEEQDGGDLSSDSTAYLNGIADAMRFLQDRATTNPYRSQA